MGNAIEDFNREENEKRCVIAIVNCSKLMCISRRKKLYSACASTHDIVLTRARRYIELLWQIADGDFLFRLTLFIMRKKKGAAMALKKRIVQEGRTL